MQRPRTETLRLLRDHREVREGGARSWLNRRAAKLRARGCEIKTLCATGTLVPTIRDAGKANALAALVQARQVGQCECGATLPEMLAAGWAASIPCIASI